jgi:predicted methyltransferase
VTGENAPVWEERYGANWPEAQAAMQETRGNVDFQTAPLDDLGVEPDSYDAITFMLNYHDTVLLPLDREAMDRAFFDALRPGGLMMISDHAGPGVRTAEQVGEVHRIDPEMVREEMEAAGFELIASSDGLANPDDDHTLNVFDPAVRGHTDRFLYLFQKPE